jgi:voltage-gated potassium channel
MALTRLLARWQRALHRELDEPGRGRLGLSGINWFLVSLIMLSIALYTINPEHELEIETPTVTWWINRIVIGAFAVEFVARFWAAGSMPQYAGLRGRFAYVRANWFMITVDLLAFLPELVYVAAGLPPPAWLRTLRVVRLFKLARYFQAFTLIVDALKTSVQPLLAALFAAALIWYLAGVAFFLAEHDAQPEKMATIGDAMWLSVMTLASVGYGDVYPVTTAGRIIAGLVAVLGLGTVALPSGIIAGAFMHRLREREKKPTGIATETERHGDG